MTEKERMRILQEKIRDTEKILESLTSARDNKRQKERQRQRDRERERKKKNISCISDCNDPGDPSKFQF